MRFSPAATWPPTPSVLTLGCNLSVYASAPASHPGSGWQLLRANAGRISQQLCREGGVYLSHPPPWAPSANILSLPCHCLTLVQTTWAPHRIGLIPHSSSISRAPNPRRSWFSHLAEHSLPPWKPLAPSLPHSCGGIPSWTLLCSLSSSPAQTLLSFRHLTQRPAGCLLKVGSPTPQPDTFHFSHHTHSVTRQTR